MCRIVFILLVSFILIYYFVVLCSYHKQHPETKTREDNEFEDWYETDNQRELNQIFSGQSQIVDSVKVLSQKLDEVVGRQERTLSLLSNVQSTMAVIGSLGGVQGQPNGNNFVVAIYKNLLIYSVYL